MVGDPRLVYDDMGSGQTVVLIHGWSGSRQYWKRNIEQLSSQCRVLAYDQRFHGDSSRSAHGFHVFRLAMDLHELLLGAVMKEEKETKVVLVGGSMGVCVILAYLELFGEASVHSVVFVDQAPLQNRKLDWNLGSKGCFDEQTLLELQHTCRTDLRKLAQGNAQGCLAQEIPQDVQALLEKETLRCDGDSLARLMEDHTNLDWRPLLPRLTVPVLNFIGGKSGVFPRQGCEFLTQSVQNGKSSIFENSSHWLYIEEPDRFSREVLEFIGSTTNST